MISILTLWMPIVLSAVIVFVASSVLHMVLRYHRSDYRKLANEDAVMDVLRAQSYEPGFYYFPHLTDPSQLKLPEAQEKFKKGPVGYVAFMPSGVPSMGQHLMQWFFFTLLMGLFIAYLGSRVLPVGTHYMTVFRFAATIGFMGYGFGQIMDSIWKGQPWSSTIKHLVDSFIYGLLTGGTFGWLWPR